MFPFSEEYDYQINSSRWNDWKESACDFDLHFCTRNLEILVSQMNQMKTKKPSGEC